MSFSLAPVRIWIFTLLIIVLIVAVGVTVAPDSRLNIGSGLVLRFVAAVIITAIAAVARIAAGRRAAAVTAVLGALIAVVLLIQPA